MLRLEPPDNGAASGPPHLALAQADTRRQQAAVTLTDLAAVTPGEGLATAGAAAPAKRRLAALTIAAIGVVYGDIGTSPLYTMREVFGSGVLPLTEASVLGVLSLVSWALFTIVTLKYVIVILRADNRGEGAFWRSLRWRVAACRRAAAMPCWSWQ